MIDLKDYILKIREEGNLPFDWVNLKPESDINAQSQKIEIYIRDKEPKLTVFEMKEIKMSF